MDFGTTYQVIQDDPCELAGFVDSDFSNCKDTSRSTTGWLFTLSGAPISWRSKRQDTIAHSTCEAEYIAASDAAKEAVWLRNFINELGTAVQVGHVPLYIDNQSAIRMTKNPEFHERSKHIERRHHHIREIVKAGTVRPVWIDSKNNLADTFTKPLNKAAFEDLRKRAGIAQVVKGQGRRTET